MLLSEVKGKEELYARMSLSNANQNPETERIAASIANLSAGNDVNMEVDVDEEEEDMDFNPFLREEISSEASSSLSSENEAPGDSVEKNMWIAADCREASVSSRLTDERQGYNYDSGNRDKETVMGTRLEEACGRDAITGNSNNMEPISSIQQGESVICPIGGNNMLSSGDGCDAAVDLIKEDLLANDNSSLNPRDSQKPVTPIDDGDAICRRTRARHSLVNYTLEELETFLQESDGDGDLQNVDDEEEYRKFLAAVLLEGVDDGQTGPEEGNLDEDEENDADFVIEIEEALESEVDESHDNNAGLSGKQEGDVRRPETRQNKRLKESTKSKNYLLGQTKTPVRPILPYVSNAQTSSFPTSGRQFLSPKSFSNCSSSLPGADPVNGFTAHQIGHLYCLMYEHVQLLIQVFSVCVLDPSGQQVATEVRKMIAEIVDKCEETLAWRKVPYPGFCFLPQNLHSSVYFDPHQTAKSSFWTPLIDKPVLSVLDVAPLALAKGYMIDVSDTVMKYRQSQLEDVGDKSRLERKPLFPLPVFASVNETVNDVMGGTTTVPPNAVQPLPPDQQQPKRSLAATLVESTKKRSVALVPKDIAELAQRFYPLFNPALFPHKPLVPAVVNRVLFTDAEDGLLAMGIMEYNNDWTAIQRRFLPCKSQHQIFIRQKNRSSSKAPENPIKAVRRMKTSPLTADELARICEGLKFFKHDWVSIWKYFVPHRDPSLLSRQWRIANGTQKSYKKSEAFKEKRRVYEAKRRQIKASITDLQSSSGQDAGNEENTAGVMDDEGEAYVHEAFLADTEFRSSNHMPYEIPLSSIGRSNIQPANMIPFRGPHISENFSAVTSECGESQHQNGGTHEVVTASNLLGDMHPLSHARDGASLIASSEQLSSNSISRPSTSHLGSWPCHMRKSKGVRVVKLAPDLPPVNLPRSVRVISQSAFKTYNNVPSYSMAGENATKNHHHGLPQVSKEGITMAKPGNHVNVFSDNGPQTNSQLDDSILADQCAAEENTSESDFHMHPLLFQATENQFPSYYSMDCTTSGTYNFFPEVPVQAESNLLGPQNSVITRTYTTPYSEALALNLCTIDFHPLLQRTYNVDGKYAVMSSINQVSDDLQSPQGNCDKSLNPSNCVLRQPLIRDSKFAPGTASPNHYEKEKLDLDIRLCSVPEKEKTNGGLDTNKHQNVGEGIPSLPDKMVERGLHGDKISINHRDECIEGSVGTNTSTRPKACPKKNAFSLEAVLPRDADAHQCTEDSHGESIPEIVMEQEELSDSEEEIQHVEFEREEMDDSEGEGLNSGQHSGIQTMEFLNLSSKEAGARGIHDLNQMPQSSYLMQEAIEKGKNCASPMQVISHNSCHAKLSRSKPINEGAKGGGRSYRSSANAPRSHLRRTSKTRNTEGASVARQLHLTTVSEGENVAHRKPKKRSLSK